MGQGDLVPRIITGFKVALQYGQDAAFKIAWPVNLSETGACVRFKLQLPEGAQIKLSIHLGDSPDPLIATCRIVWVNFDEANQYYYYGVGFLNLNPEALEKIRLYVEQGSQILLYFMSQFPLFSDFSRDDCRELLKIITVHQLEAQEILYREGSDSISTQGLYIVQSGLLGVLSGAIPKLEKQVAVISPGQIFGETTLLVDQPHSATIKAINPTRLIQVNKVGFQLLREDQPVIALKVLEMVVRTLAGRLGRTTKKLFSPTYA